MSMRGMPALHDSPDGPTSPSSRQRLFIYYFTATLTDLVVLGLFDQYSSQVHIDGFGILLLAAVVLQVMLKLAIALEHRWSGYCSQKAGKHWTWLRLLGAWQIMFLGKFVVLEALSLIFGDKVRFEGPLYGLAWLILVVTVMLVAEELLLRLYRHLGDPGPGREEGVGVEGR